MVLSTEHRGPVHIAFCIDDGARERNRSVGNASEGIQHCLGPGAIGRCQLKYGAATTTCTLLPGAAAPSGTVKVAAGVENYVVGTVLAEIAEGLDNRLGPAARGR